MQLAHIFPTNLLHLTHCVSHHSKIHLILAQEVLKSERYASHYLSLQRAGHHIILDNGAYELGSSVSNVHLMACARLLMPSEVVCPDVLFDKEATIKHSNAFMLWLGSYGDIHGHIKPFVVPQGKNINEWVQCLAALIGLSQRYLGTPPTIGIMTRLAEVAKTKTRTEALKRILAESPETAYTLNRHSVHMLGCDNNFDEIRTTAKLFPFVRSLDTAKVVRLGLEGYELTNDRNTYPRLKRPDDYFERDWSIDNTPTILINMTTANNWAEGNHPHV